MSCLPENDVAVLDYIFDPNLTGNYDINRTEEELEVHSENDGASTKVSELELSGIKLAEEGDLAGALELFTRAISEAESASGYNNRAQAHRLNGDEKSAMKDLERALELSGRKGRVGRQAFCQRGVILRKLGHDDQARADFSAASLLGSNFARKQLVEMNPYAAMCNQMMKQMLLPRNEA